MPHLPSDAVGDRRDLATTSVFLDFDGTVSLVDVSDHLVERLASSGWQEVDAANRAGHLGTRAWLLEMWERLPHEEAMLRAVASEIAVDEGFESLVRALREAGADVTVVSDGFGFYVEEACRPLGIAVLTNRPDFATGRLELPYEDRCCPCATCGVCKQAPIKEARRDGRTTVLVGDGSSDFKAALLADVVFARGDLAAWCAANGIAHRPFECLAEVERALVG